MSKIYDLIKDNETHTITAEQTVLEVLVGRLSRLGAGRPGSERRPGARARPASRRRV